MILIVLLSCFVSLGLGLTGSRSGLISLLLWTILVTFLYQRKTIRWFSFGLFVVALIGHVTLQAQAPEIERYLPTKSIWDYRLGVWANSVQMISTHPLFGVGLGNFNFSWVLTSFSEKPVEFFTDPHNVVLRIAVECGIPTALLFATGLFGIPGYYVTRLLRSRRVELRFSKVAPLAILAPIMAHAMVEYPLSYAYFLLPAAIATGLMVANSKASSISEEVAYRSKGFTRSLFAGVLACLAILSSMSVSRYLTSAERFDESLRTATEKKTDVQVFPFDLFYRLIVESPTESIDERRARVESSARLRFRPSLLCELIAVEYSDGSLNRAGYLWRRLGELRMGEDHVARCKRQLTTELGESALSRIANADDDASITWRDFISRRSE
jgi:hypothetical protein